MKATNLLENQHRTVEELLEKLEIGEGDRVSTLKELADRLGAHMTIEQELFYPTVRALDEDLIDACFEDHAIAEIALERLIAARSDDDLFDGRVKALQELLARHIEEEEEELFPTVEDGIDDEQSVALAASMKRRFDEAMATGFQSRGAGVFVTTSADAARPTRHHGDHRAV